jgi:hypothetical protein
MKRTALGLGVVGVLVLAGSAWAEERPAEEDMFGGDGQTAAAIVTTTATATATSTATTTATETGTAVDARDNLNMGDPNAGTRFSAEVAPDDPLKIGGQFYWRVMSSGKQGQYPQDWSLSAPALLDVFMDARPNDRVRAFVLGRMSYDPTLPPNGTTTSTGINASTTSAQGSDSVSSLFGQATRGPSVALDQMWLRFDLLHTVFVTAGKQHVRWGTARFWTPTDYLHLLPRNPLLPFDPRTGTTMLKLHVPWEARGWNFYAYALPEAVTATSTTGDIAGAARAEIVLGTFEAGAGVFGQRNSKAKFAGDFSFGVWDLDFYGEAALRNAGDVDFVSFHKALITCVPDVPPQTCADSTTGNSVDPTSLPSLVDTFFPFQRGSGWKPQVTGGVSYTRQYADKDTFTVGAEYFYNGLGYASADVYPGLILPRNTPLTNPATFFYLGRHYLGVFATAPAPYSWDNTTFTLSALGNLSDKSGLARLDYSLTVLTHVRFEAYGAVHFGQRNGEFRFGIDGNKLIQPGSASSLQSLANDLTIQPGLFDVGVGLRVAL